MICLVKFSHVMSIYFRLVLVRLVYVRFGQVKSGYVRLDQSKTD